MIDRFRPAEDYLSRIRGIPLLPGERVARVFSLQDGLLDEPTKRGRLLITTNLRILFFQNSRGYDEVFLFPVGELKGVVVDSRMKGTLSLLWGILAVTVASLFYLLAAYWVTGRVESPALPGLNMDFLPFIILAATLAGAWLFWRRNIKRAGGKVTLRGANWDLSFAYLGAERVRDINAMVETLFICRQGCIERLYSQPERETAPSGYP